MFPIVKIGKPNIILKTFFIKNLYPLFNFFRTIMYKSVPSQSPIDSFFFAFTLYSQNKLIQLYNVREG